MEPAKPLHMTGLNVSQTDPPRAPFILCQVKPCVRPSRGWVMRDFVTLAKKASLSFILNIDAASVASFLFQPYETARPQWALSWLWPGSGWQGLVLESPHVHWLIIVGFNGPEGTAGHIQMAHVGLVVVVYIGGPLSFYDGNFTESHWFILWVCRLPTR